MEHKILLPREAKLVYVDHEFLIYIDKAYFITRINLSGNISRHLPYKPSINNFGGLKFRNVNNIRFSCVRQEEYLIIQTDDDFNTNFIIHLYSRIIYEFKIQQDVMKRRFSHEQERYYKRKPLLWHNETLFLHEGYTQNIYIAKLPFMIDGQLDINSPYVSNNISEMEEIIPVKILDLMDYIQNPEFHPICMLNTLEGLEIIIPKLSENGEPKRIFFVSILLSKCDNTVLSHTVLSHTVLSEIRTTTMRQISYNIVKFTPHLLSSIDAPNGTYLNILENTYYENNIVGMTDTLVRDDRRCTVVEHHKNTEGRYGYTIYIRSNVKSARSVI